MKRFVLDASVALSWFIDHPVAPRAAHVSNLLTTGHRAIVPPLWQFEMVNGFLVAERRGSLSVSDVAQALDQLELVTGPAIEIRQEPIPMRRLLLIGREFRLTAYDAAYLDTARELRLELATLDRQLAKAAVEAGVPLLP